MCGVEQVPRKANFQMAKKVAVPTFVLTVTKAVEKEYENFGYYNRTTYVKHLCLTGTTDDGKRYWVKLPAGKGLTVNGPVVAVGDTVLLQAKVKGHSDDGTMTFLNFGKLLAVADDTSTEADALLDEYANLKVAA